MYVLQLPLRKKAEATQPKISKIRGGIRAYMFCLHTVESVLSQKLHYARVGSRDRGPWTLFPNLHPLSTSLG